MSRNQAMKLFSVDELLATAGRETGLADFGPDDFLEPLGVLVAGLNEEAQISETRRPMLEARLLRLLKNRLYMAKDLTAHPEIRDIDLGSPVIIGSLPRSGSTKLHRMLAAGGDFQYLTLWKVHHFSRIPDAVDGGVEQRIADTRQYEKWVYETSPAMLSGHPQFTDEAEEDQFLMEATFRHPIVFGMFASLRYAQWIMQADMRPTFDYYLLQLRYQQWQFGGGRPWLVKTPNHLGSEALLSSIYRQPRFIFPHRDPVQCIPSVTAMTMAYRRLYSDYDSSAQLAAGAMGLFQQVTQIHMDWRETNPQAPVLDLAFREITEDGIAAARRVYDFLGMELSPRAETAMRTWQDDNSLQKHGRNTYSAAAIGTTDANIREHFARYRERFADYI